MSAAPTVVFLHAHPDDESIFTGGTIAHCVASDVRTVLVVATSGGLGRCARRGAELTQRREDEARDAASILGIDRIEFLRYRDSGMPGDPRNNEPGRFSTIDGSEAAARVAQVLREEEAAALVTYDRRGIYGHPDHIKVHTVGRMAAESAGVATIYEATVDREYLDATGPHLVERACGGRARELGLGAPSVAITTTVPVGDHFGAKRAAMRAHRSQVPRMAIDPGVYGAEWYIRRGPAAVLDALAA